jgi:hypothetical protein
MIKRTIVVPPPIEIDRSEPEPADAPHRRPVADLRPYLPM